MSYPGNTSLSQEIRQRILSTFKQTLSMAGEEKRQEAMLGCDFILRLDPKFELARTLQSRIQSGEGAIETNDLINALEAASTVDTGPAEVIETADELFEAPVEQVQVAATVSETTDTEAPLGEFWDEDDEAAVALEGEDEQQSQQRINDLLQEGQQSFEEGAYQPAIDSWSRIFLIDIDHEEATRRIELARKLKAEVERKVEEVFHEGLSFIENGSFESARGSFQKVLEMNPHHMAAREYLQKLDESPADLGPAPAPAQSIRSRMPEPTTGDDLADESLLPPLTSVELETEESPSTLTDPTATAQVSETQTFAAGQIRKKAGNKRTFQMIAAAGVLIVLVLAWFLYSRRQQMFPNSTDEAAPAGQTQVIDPIARATALFEEGRTALAIAQLRRLPPDHPKQAEAEALIAQWEISTVQESMENDPASEDLLAHRQALLTQARTAFEADQNLTAAARLGEADSIVPLEGPDQELQQQVSERLASLNSELELIRQGDWEFALPGLWRIHVDDPLNRDARRLLIDSYFNIGVRELQRGDPRSALESFKEALNLDPDDPELRKLSALARTYEEREADLLYRIFVKYQPFR